MSQLRTNINTAIGDAIFTILAQQALHLPSMEMPIEVKSDICFYLLASRLNKVFAPIRYLNRSECERGQSNAEVAATGHIPDIAVYYVGARGSLAAPIMVVEVASGNKIHELEDIAKWYIENGKGFTKIVITVAIADEITIQKYRHKADVGGNAVVEQVKLESPAGMDGGVGIRLREIMPDDVVQAAEQKKFLDMLELEWRLDFRAIANALVLE